MFPQFLILTLLLTAGSVTPARAATPLAPELSGLGSLRVPVTTAVPRAQRFFDQGVKLLYAFNHPEALRAFREAARLDPDLALAYWGQAMTLAPNLNAPLTPENARTAYEALQRALALRPRASARERALIDALATRFAAEGVGDRPALDRAYAAAMRDVAARYPEDPDIQTFFADAVMNTMPWDYWQKDGGAKPDTAIVIAALEAAIARHPDHPGAHHYYIHVLEASNNPDRAVASADRLGALMPAAGHMVHMPAHIYIRVGRYADAAEANVRAIDADEDYLAQCQAQGLYPLTYYPHNLHFLWAAATLEGRGVVAVDAARQVAAKVPHHHAGAVAWTTDFPVTPLLAYARFGRWQEILTEPSPPANAPYAVGIWHYARGLAFIAGDRLDRAEAEVSALKAVLGHEAFKTTLKDLPLLANLQIATNVVEGELAARQGRVDAGIDLLKKAVAIDDGFPYAEPPLWHQPPRQVLGALLLEAGRAKDAETVYLKDLDVFRDNGWSLFGLVRSLEAQGRRDESAAAERRFKKAWARADVALTSSRVMSPKPQSITLPTGVRLDYVEQGDPSGLPVVLLHGYTDSWRSFEPVLPHLPASLRVFAVTQRGHGNSARPPKGYTPGDFANDVAAFLDAFNIPRAVIVGHSMGATVAQRLAVDRPDRVLGLVLEGAFMPKPGNRNLREFWELIAKLADPIDPAFVREFQESTVAKPVAPALLDTAVRESLKVPARVWQAALEPFLDLDLSSEITAIGVPTLLVWGDRDAFVPRSEQDALTAAIAGSTLLVYPGGGHSPHWEDPAQFAVRLSAFVQRLVTRTHTTQGAM